MKTTIISKEINIPFIVVYNRIKSNIEQSDFLLLHEIDTQKIVSNHNVQIKGLKQLLFFKPKYIAQIIEQDSLAINDIPLKIVIHELEDNLTSVSYQNPMGDLGDYNLSEDISKELLKHLTLLSDTK